MVAGWNNKNAQSGNMRRRVEYAPRAQKVAHRRKSVMQRHNGLRTAERVAAGYLAAFAIRTREQRARNEKIAKKKAAARRKRYCVHFGIFAKFSEKNLQKSQNDRLYSATLRPPLIRKNFFLGAN